jgi:outer membrane protein TolC
MSYRHSIPAFILAAAVLTGTASAETLTLDQAFRLALTHNRNLQAGSENIQQARIQKRQAWSIMGPTASAQANQSWNNEVVTQFPGPTGQPIDVVVRPGQSRTFTLSGTQPIFVAQFIPALQNAGRSQALAQANIRDAQEQVLYNVANLYFNVVAAEQFVELSRRSYENLLEHLATAEARFEVGQLPRMGVLQAQIEVTRAQATWTRARNDYTNALAALANLIGIPQIERLQPAGELVERISTQATPGVPFATNATAAALEKRPDLEAARKQLDLAQGGRTAGWYAFSPSLVANGQYQVSSDPGALGAGESWTVMLVLNVPILEGGRRILDLQESASRIRQAERLMEAKRDEVSLDVQTAISNLRVGMENLELAVQQQALARENFEIARISFESGLITSLDVIDANQALLSSEINALREQFNARLDRYNYLRATGQLREGLGLNE